MVHIERIRLVEVFSILALFLPSSSCFQQQHTPKTWTTKSSTKLWSSTLEKPESTAGVATQNIFGTVSDAVTGGIFSLLHLQDETGIQDASKNLRVLWARALLHASGKLDDTVAAQLLPPSTRGLVASKEGASLFEGGIQFLEWIQARTEFIDQAVDSFLSSPACQPDGKEQDCQIVLFGAGYDTRALRYRHAHDDKLQFIEVDLPDVVEGKERLYKKFAKDNDPDWDFKNKGSNFVPFDLNGCGGSNPKSLIEVLKKEGGLREDIPTLFVFEAVLFYVEEDAIRNIMGDLSSFMGSWRERGAEALLCMTDSLKPFVDVPFTSETDKFFSSQGMDLLEHRARWGGAVHFALASNGVEEASTERRRERKHGELGGYVASKSDSLVYSYLPTRANNADLLDNPSFDNAWYAVAYPWQIDGFSSATEAEAAKGKERPEIEDPFATRLWGEPVVIYRDSDNQPVCVTDVCPHRSAPLSMGTVENGELTCFYHGWKFGKKGECTDVPTLRAVSPDKVDKKRESKFRERVSETFCQKRHACVEHEGLIWMWRGDVLTADPSKLPSRRKGDMETVTMDTVLDYNVDYSYIIENNLDSVHLFYLHDGSVPPLVSIGMMNKNLERLRLSSFKDDCGIGHLGKLGDEGRPKKLIRFDPPNIVRHGGVSGFEEEFHIIPIAPHRTRVLLRQHIPKGPILSTVTGVPGMTPFLTTLVNNWNYHIGLEDASVMKGQSHLIEEFGAPRMQMGGLGDDLVTKYWKWRNQAHENLQEKDAEGQTHLKSPYFSTYGKYNGPISIGTGTSIFGDQSDTADLARSAAQMATTSNNNAESAVGEYDAESGGDSSSIWGIKRTYTANTPVAEYPPMNYKRYKSALRWDDLTKTILAGQEPSCTMIKTSNEPPKTESASVKPVSVAIGASAMIAMAGIATAVNALNILE